MHTLSMYTFIINMSLYLIRSYVSHSWDASFGMLVAALADHADLNRVVWIDIFSINQWPSFAADESYMSMVCPNIDSFIGRKDDFVYDRLHPLYRTELPMFRLWCWEELRIAFESNIAVVIKAGDLFTILSVHSFDARKSVLRRLKLCIDIKYTDTTNAKDKDRILKNLMAFEGRNYYHMYM